MSCPQAKVFLSKGAFYQSLHWRFWVYDIFPETLKAALSFPSGYYSLCVGFIAQNPAGWRGTNIPAASGQLDNCMEERAGWRVGPRLSSASPQVFDYGLSRSHPATEVTDHVS